MGGGRVLWCWVADLGPPLAQVQLLQSKLDQGCGKQGVSPIAYVVVYMKGETLGSEAR